MSEYYPDSVRYAKELEFLQLTQGNKSVAEYAERFKHLGRFYTMPLDEEWRCRKFENGLKGDIRLMVAPLSIKNFAALVEKARVMEKMKLEVKAQQYPQQRVSRSSWSRPRVKRRRSCMLGLIHSFRGLKAFLPRLEGSSATMVGDHMWRVFTRSYQVSAGATIVVGRATFVEIVPL